MPPRTPDVKKWAKFLDRKLTKKEKELIENTEDEYIMNRGIAKLIKKINNDNIYIPRLSVTDGNCLFDSICYHLQEIEPLELRKLISNFMRIYKYFKGIFNFNELSLNEMFEFQNEIEYLHDNDNDKLYKYTFDIMCSDLECEHSWKRLPTELVLLCVSYIFDIKINIYHDNGHMTEICSIENPIKEIYIGLLGEAHYIPLNIKNDSDPDDIFYIYQYNDYTDKYKKWIKKVTSD
jgi:hypothetical protein